MPVVEGVRKIRSPPLIQRNLRKKVTAFFHHLHVHVHQSSFCQNSLFHSFFCPKLGDASEGILFCYSLFLLMKESLFLFFSSSSSSSSSFPSIVYFLVLHNFFTPLQITCSFILVLPSLLLVSSSILV